MFIWEYAFLPKGHAKVRDYNRDCAATFKLTNSAPIGGFNPCDRNAQSLRYYAVVRLIESKFDDVRIIVREPNTIDQQPSQWVALISTPRGFQERLIERNLSH